MPSAEIGNTVPFFDVKDSNGRHISLMGTPYVLYFYSKDEIFFGAVDNGNSS